MGTGPSAALPSRTESQALNQTPDERELGSSGAGELAAVWPASTGSSACSAMVIKEAQHTRRGGYNFHPLRTATTSPSPSFVLTPVAHLVGAHWHPRRSAGSPAALLSVEG